MKVVDIKEGFMLEWFAPYLVNNDPTGMTDEEINQFDAWYKENVPYGCEVILITDDEPEFNTDDVTGELGNVYPYKIVRFIRD